VHNVISADVAHAKHDIPGHDGPFDHPELGPDRLDQLGLPLVLTFGTLNAADEEFRFRARPRYEIDLAYNLCAA
jgi:hypothetical protein